LSETVEMGIVRCVVAVGDRVGLYVILPAASHEMLQTFKPRVAQRINIGRVRYMWSLSHKSASC
ncbi:MAG: hypothetical protein ACK5Q5_11325, partial [Planctomycetaceae bacterium]